MKKLQFNSFRLIGIGLHHKTTNLNGQSFIDCGKLWQKFAREDFFNRIDGKVSNRILAVYHSYEGDHTQPYDYFIGCEVGPETEVPEGMKKLEVPAATYQIQSAFGKIPECLTDAWRDIWASGMDRSFQADFEVYDHRSKNLNDAMVDIFVSVNS